MKTLIVTTASRRLVPNGGRLLFEKESIMTLNKNIAERDLDHLVYEIYGFIEFFNKAFFDLHPVSVPILSFEVNREKSLGHYPVEGKTCGEGNDIKIYKVNPHQDLWEILTNVLHLMVHTWQNHHGQSSKSWFHNKEFRSKMAEFGIECNKNGCHTGLGDPFVFLLKKHGVIFGDRQDPNGIICVQPKCKLKGNSKLKKWSCGCTNVRVAVSLEAKCLKCDQLFELVS